MFTTISFRFLFIQYNKIKVYIINYNVSLVSIVRGETRSRRSAPPGVANSRYDSNNPRYESLDPLFQLRQ